MSEDLEINHKVWAEYWKAWALGVGLILATMAVIYGVQPWFIRQENTNVRASFSYVSTHQGILRQLKTSYDGVTYRVTDTPNDDSHQPHLQGLRSQQRSIILQMRQEADLIPNDVPSDIRDFLASH
jgi:hypothetical protein